ncbi:hypothetical protein NDU88_003037 [Pleurodeles waltl]|uniref:Uncharacterized protein n=1 Tax=Pleurodeles waltl TaxID=8319 RepID=A0AAV7T464_PLEWA|nr:hypothetical protein NDU88_003037 [Pleurodeles waltl]
MAPKCGSMLSLPAMRQNCHIPELCYLLPMGATGEKYSGTSELLGAFRRSGSLACENERAIRLQICEVDDSNQADLWKQSVSLSGSSRSSP